ncbi:MAG: Crp/Fnr family transcriptional regulator [Burkholderiales bacterium]|nr:Crp/Fnr family transcriptional regulator [Burkholderiales bacterium]
MAPSFTQLHPELAELLPGELHAFCTTGIHQRGERLFATGSKPVNMFFIRSGEVILERIGAHGGSAVLQRSRHGFVGEASLQSARYHCDGKVIATSEITQIPIAQVRTAMDADPVFASRWITMLNREVKRLRLQCERLSLCRVQDRLMHLLETEGKSGKYPLGSGLKSLASELGVTHEALYRCVSMMERDRTLMRDSGHLQLVHR